MKAYVARFAGLSITTEDWLNHFHAYWNEADHPTQHEALKAVDFDAWINGEGLYLPVDMKFDTSLADAAYALAERWDKERSATKGKFGKKDIGEFSANQVSLFLDTVVGYPAFARDAIDEMEAVYAFNESGNPEIKLRWYSLALKGGLYTVEAAKWVETAGRMKYCRPIYKAINRVDPALAKKTFLESGVHFLHPIAKRMIAQDLGIDA
ncbi:hypothetical protein MNV49_002391 [Pseudohyphozyma bogoriensis]|nr:hypothetical protein MNV49_002391 [Pseudohyphozyma bogoriensis]